MEGGKGQFSSPEIAYIVRHDGTGVAGEREFDEVIVGLVGEVWTPEVVNLHPSAHRKVGLEERLALCCGNGTPFHQITTPQQIFMFEKKGGSHQRRGFAREARAQNCAVASGRGKQGGNENI